MNEKELKALTNKVLLENKDRLEKVWKEEREIKDQIERCLDKYKKLCGVKPYNIGYNPCYQDGYFAKSIEKEFDNDIRYAALSLLSSYL